VKLRNPQFEGQDEDEGSETPASRVLSRRPVNAQLAQFLEENPQDARAIINKTIAAMRGAPMGARKARELRRGAVGARQLVASGASSPTARFATPRPPSSTSSRAIGGPAARIWAATATYQAILPLRGKIINSEKKPDQQVSLEQRDPGR